MKPTIRELLGQIAAHEGFLKDAGWVREEDSLVFLLAERVEVVLKLVEPISREAVPSRELARSVLRALEGER